MRGLGVVRSALAAGSLIFAAAPACGQTPHHPVSLYDQIDVSSSMPAPTSAEVINLEMEALQGNAGPTAILFEPAERYGGPIGGAADAVGRLALKFRDRKTGAEGANWCTAWLISSDTVMTNYHCYPGLDNNQEVVEAKMMFRYLRSGEEGQIVPVRGPRCVSPELDFALLEIEPEYDGPSLPRPLSFRIRDPLPLEPLYMVHHPAARPLQLTIFGCRAGTRSSAEYQSGIFEHTCQTLGMSSGAPLFSLSDNRIVGIHFSGPARPLVSLNAPNQARSMRTIFYSSPYLMSLLPLAEQNLLRTLPATSVYFSYDRATPDEQSYLAAETLLNRIMTSQSVSRILLVGNTDSTFPANYSVRLSARMARSVADRLNANGISAEMISMDGHGNSRNSLEDTAASRNPLSNRVEVYVYDAEGRPIGFEPPPKSYLPERSAHCSLYGVENIQRPPDQ